MGLPARRLWKRLTLMLALSTLIAAGGCKHGPWRLWNSYAARFIDEQGRVIDPEGGSRTTSEGQAYAMFFALADNDRPTFDRLLAWTQANMASGDLYTHLPSWLWGRDKDGAWKALDPNSASDADVWMAYTLVEAGRLWDNPAYTDLGRHMISQIAQREVVDLPGFGQMLLPGPMGFVHERSSKAPSQLAQSQLVQPQPQRVQPQNAPSQIDRFWTLNPSYLPLFVFERLADVHPNGPWRQIALNIPRFLRESARDGFAMDWVEYVPGVGFNPALSHPGPPEPGKDAEAPVGGYDAIRVYLWAGMINGEDKTRGEVLSAVPAMSAYLAEHDTPPEKINDRGIPSAQDGPIGFSAAVLPYLRAFPHMEKPISRQATRLSMQKNATNGLYGRDFTYYDQNLILFATGFIDGRFRFGPGGELKVEWTRK
jgi:endoglucanase